MKFESFLICDTSGKKSLTATAFAIGFTIVNIKFLVSGLIINGITMSDFSGIDYSAAVAGLGAVYVLRRQKNEQTSE